MCELCFDPRVVHASPGNIDTKSSAIARRSFLRLAVGGAATVAAASALVQTFDQPVVSASAGKQRMPQVTTRSQWGADESIRGATVIGWAPVRKIVIHHTASPNRVKNAAATVRYGYNYHVVTRGFSDIGYHFLISPDGEIFEGRRARTYSAGEPHTGEDGAKNAVIGGHSLGKNAGTVGIALIGNFSDVKPSNAALSSLANLVAWEAQRHSIDPLGKDPYIDLGGTKSSFYNIVGHRGIRQTACPGATMIQLMPWLRQESANRVGSYPGRTADMRRLAWLL